MTCKIRKSGMPPLPMGRENWLVVNATHGIAHISQSSNGRAGYTVINRINRRKP